MSSGCGSQIGINEMHALLCFPNYARRGNVPNDSAFCQRVFTGEPMRKHSPDGDRSTTKEKDLFGKGDIRSCREFKLNTASRTASSPVSGLLFSECARSC